MIVAVGPVASSRRAVGGIPSTCITIARMTPPWVTQTIGRARAGVRVDDVARRREAALGHLGVRLALLPAGAAGEPARVALGVARLDLVGREPEPLADVDLAPAARRRSARGRCAAAISSAVSRARGRSDE